jgi:hypothetical protein
MKKKVKDVGVVDNVRTRDELHTIGFELQPEKAREFAEVLVTAAERGESYVWIDKRTSRLHVTMVHEDEVDHADKFNTESPMTFTD